MILLLFFVFDLISQKTTFFPPLEVINIHIPHPRDSSFRSFKTPLENFQRWCWCEELNEQQRAREKKCENNVWSKLLYITLGSHINFPSHDLTPSSLHDLGVDVVFISTHTESVLHCRLCYLYDVIPCAPQVPSWTSEISTIYTVWDKGWAQLENF